MPENMRKRIAFTTVSIIVIVLFVYYAFFDISHFVGQQEQYTVISPDGKYEVVIYMNNGGATTDYALLCTVRSLETKRERNIYWDYPFNNPEVEWLDNQTVVINGIEVNAFSGIYDYRRGK